MNEFTLSGAWPTAMNIGFGVAALLAYPVYKMLLAMRSRQTVSEYVEEHAHKQGTPTMGGLIIGAGFLSVCGWLAAQIHGQGEQPQWAFPILYVGFAIIGFLDDFVVPRLMKGKRGLGWTQKLLLQIVFALGSAWLLSSSADTLTIGATVFLILFFSNAYNFADGMDWLAGLLLLAIVAGLNSIAVMVGVSLLQPYLVGLAAASVPFLWLNKPRAKVFMGDVGALPIGAVLGAFVAVLALPGLCSRFQDPASNVPAPSVWLALLLVSVVMIAELVPVPLQILSVKLRGKRMFPATPIHHAFQRAGWQETKVVALFVIVQIVASAMAYGVVERAAAQSTLHSGTRE